MPLEFSSRRMMAHSSPSIGAAEIEAVRAVLQSGQLAGGTALPEFRREISRIAGAGRTFIFPSGRVAVLAALAALNVERGRSVVVQTYVCDAVVWAIKQAGLVPTFCDIGAGWVATPETVAQAISDRAGAIVLAPPFGLFQSAQPFREFGLPIIHDLCQASPATLADRWEEAGDLIALSFHATKYLLRRNGRGSTFTRRPAPRMARQYRGGMARGGHGR